MTSARKIAKEAGVSIGTVSRVLNNKAGVSDATRHRVIEVAQELNYALPRRLPLPMTTLTHLGLLVRSVSESSILANPFYADVYHGVEQACRERDLHLAFNVLEVADARLRRLPTLINDERIGGLITLGALPPPVMDELARARAVPLVMVDNWTPEPRWDSVMMDNAGGVTLAVEHLIAQGHREIVFVAGPPHPSIVERQHGYTASVQRHGLPAHVITTLDLGLADGEAAANALIENHPTATAVACANDMLAIGLIRRLVQQGVRVPAQVAVTGFDDIELASFTQPALTTVYVDRVAFGRLAVELLLGRVNSPARPPVRCTLGVRLVVRESTASMIHSNEKDN